MKKSLQSLVLLLMALMVPVTATAAYNQLAEGVYLDGTTLYITSGVTSLGDLQVDPSEIYCYATIPPACVSNTFTGYGATLHVPAAGMVSYFTALYWYNFNNILSDAIEPLSVTMNTTDAEVGIGQQLSLSATVAPGDATPKTVYWSSSDASVATVSASGTVTAVATGECDILATCVDKVAVCHITVVKSCVTITLDKHEARLLPNHTMTLTATCSPIDVDLVVSSSNLGVAIPRLVNGTILVVGVAEGTATITVNAADAWSNPDSCVVTVYTEPGDVNSDGYVNISDVTALIDYLLSGNPSGVNLTGADCNNDGGVNISDVTTLIDYLLSGKWPWNQDMIFTVNGVSFKMVYVEGGTFTMGATEEMVEDFWDDIKPAHQVTLSDYAIGQTEVTQALWVAVMGTNPSRFNDDLQRPVECVSWNDCQYFIDKLNQLTGKNFRLPTEAEWEYAARGGNKSLGYQFAGSDYLNDVAWFDFNSYYVGTDNPNYGPHAVKNKIPNELDLYDMSGNVREWCLDWYGNYSRDAQTDPIGPASGSYRVIRGGGWYFPDLSCLTLLRDAEMTPYTDMALGLRLALGNDISPFVEHEWVDLGLPSGTLWATCNVGATIPEDYGNYFAWGETAPKNYYDWSTYKWCDRSHDTMTKYCTDSNYGIVDNKTELDPDNDAAYVNWGPKWRMPSLEQQQELVDNCTWTWTTSNGVNGHLVTAPNGNSLFLPAAGYRWQNHIDSRGSSGKYWSCTLYPSFSYYASSLHFDSSEVISDVSNRYFGFTVRAVRVP